MSNPNSKLPPVIHYGTAHPDPNPPPSQPTDSTMLLASVSEQYGSSIPPSRFARNKGENKTAVAPPPAAAAPAPTVDTKTAKHGSLPMFLTSEYSDIIWFITLYVFDWNHYSMLHLLHRDVSYDWCYWFCDCNMVSLRLSYFASMLYMQGIFSKSYCSFFNHLQVSFRRRIHRPWPR